MRQSCFEGCAFGGSFGKKPYVRIAAVLKGRPGFLAAPHKSTPPDDQSGVFRDGRWAAFFAPLAGQGGAEMA